MLHSVNKTCIMAGRSFKRWPVKSMYSYRTYETIDNNKHDNSEEQIMIMFVHTLFSHSGHSHHSIMPKPGF